LRLPTPRVTAVAVILAGTLLAVVLSAPAAIAQCAMCKATLEGSSDGVGGQFNRAILVMLAGPYLVMGAFGFLLFRERLRHASGHLLARLRRRLRPGAER
jgi:hypothetical protein